MLDHIYKHEIADGLEKVLSNSSIAYHSEVMPASNLLLDVEDIFKNVNKELIQSTTGSESFDLYPIKTILVSVGINKNDDIFTPREMWVARNTPEDKPFNVEHEQKKIIGHITSSYPIDTNFKFIPDTIPLDKVPDKYHILTTAVIYKIWEDKDYEAQIAKIIEEIENGEWFVSMECLFRGFDYGLTSATGEHRIVARNDETSFLTKYLKSYGGKGVYQDNKIGRVLRNITFSGKGLVRKPANPESIIFNDRSFANLVYLDNNDSNSQIVLENNEMDDVLKNQIADLKATIATLTSERDALRKDLAETSTSSTKAQINSLSNENTDLKEKLTAAQALIAENIAEITQVKATLEKERADNSEYRKEAEKMYKEASKNSRKSKAMIALKIEDADAEKFVTAFEGVSDEHFDAVLTVALMSPNTKVEDPNTPTDKVPPYGPNPKPVIPANMTPKSPSEYIKSMTSLYTKSNDPQKLTYQYKSATQDPSAVLENVEPAKEAATAGVNTDDDLESTTASVRKSISKFMLDGKYLGRGLVKKSKKNKGE